MLAVSGAYIAFLWLPISPEKAVTCTIALVLIRVLFPRHQEALKEQVKLIFKTRKKPLKKKRDQTKTEPRQTK